MSRRGPGRDGEPLVTARISVSRDATPARTGMAAVLRARLPLYRKPTDPRALDLRLRPVRLADADRPRAPRASRASSASTRSPTGTWTLSILTTHALGTVGLVHLLAGVCPRRSARSSACRSALFFVLWDSFLIVNLVWLTGRMTPWSGWSSCPCRSSSSTATCDLCSPPSASSGSSTRRSGRSGC